MVAGVVLVRGVRGMGRVRRVGGDFVACRAVLEPSLDGLEVVLRGDGEPGVTSTFEEG